MRRFNGGRRRPAQLRPARRAARPSRPIAWRTGAWPARRSTTGASSTSTSWPPSAWRCPRSSTRGPPPRLPAAGRGQRDRAAGRSSGRALRARRVLPARCRRPAVRRRGASDERRRASRAPLYVVAEKILAPGEQLPDGWAVAGTTGYEFLNLVNGIFVDRSQAARDGRSLRAASSGRRPPFGEVVDECKRLDHGDLDGQRGQHARPSPRPDLRAAPLAPATSRWAASRRRLREIIACLPGLSHLRRRAGRRRR